MDEEYIGSESIASMPLEIIALICGYIGYEDNVNLSSSGVHLGFTTYFTRYYDVTVFLYIN